MSEQPISPLSESIGVLICDDSDSLRLLLYVVLTRDASLRVVGEAENGVKAIEQAQQLQPDVILLDLSMPVLTGLEALPQIKLAAPAAQIIAFTGFSSSVVEQAVFDAGADDVLEKGAAPDAITDAVKKAYAAGQRGALTRASA